MSDKLPIGCTECEKFKSVHLTQIVGDDVKTLHLCNDCPLAKDAANIETVDIVYSVKPSLKSGDSEIKSIGRGLSCPKCGFTQESFKEFGRLGCPCCYDVFASSLDAVLRKAHRGVKHKGKSPANFEPPVDVEEINALKEVLKKHVDREEYEKAAELRDRIWELESRIS